MKAPKVDNKEYELVPADNHVARLYKAFRIGTVSEEYLGNVKDKDKIILYFELPNEMRVFKEGEGEKPMSISKEMAFSQFERAPFRAFTEALLGVSLKDEEAEAVDVQDLLGLACLLEVEHKVSAAGRNYAKVKGASKLPKGMTCPPLVNPPTVFDATEASQDEINALPDWLREKVQSSAEYKARFAPEATVEAPFPDSSMSEEEDEGPAF